MRVDPPSRLRPYWSDNADRRPLTLPLLLLADPARHQQLQLAHADAVRELMLVAFAAREDRDHDLARELFTRAGRLCTEPLGQFPLEPPR